MIMVTIVVMMMVTVMGGADSGSDGSPNSSSGALKERVTQTL